jgi:beta-galactosidase
MEKKITITALFILSMTFGVFAQSNEWQDPKVNAVNRMPMKASYFAYEDRATAENGVINQSDRFLSLNGLWKFFWVQGADQRPTNFFTVGYDDVGWKTMSVPGIWEAHGYGQPVYINNGWAWRNQFVTDQILRLNLINVPVFSAAISLAGRIIWRWEAN